MQGLNNLPHKSGIYKITNLINGKGYIGQSKDIYHRCNEQHLYGGNSPETASFHIYQAFNKYGIQNFKVEVLELCNQKELNDREIYWIAYYDTFHNGYNMTEGGSHFSPNIYSDETEEKRRRTRENNKSLQCENHPRAKMSNKEVWDVRERYKLGETIEEIYQDFKDRYSNIMTFQRIVLGKTYAKVGNIPTAQDKAKKHSNRKFNDSQIISIRKAYYEQRITQTELAMRYGVSQSVIKDIVNYKTYTEIEADIKNQRHRIRYRFTDDEVREIRDQATKGVSPIELAKRYKVDSSVIYNCINYKTYKNVQ